jgi:hypothetical protein
VEGSILPLLRLQHFLHAVSLIPSTVVVGTSIKFLYLSLISTLLGISIASLTFSLLRKRHSGSDKEEPKSRVRNQWNSYLLVLLPVAASLAWNNININEWSDLLYWSASSCSPPEEEL